MGIFNSEKLIGISVPDLVAVTNRLVEHFRAQGYDVTASNEDGDWAVSITKGGMFHAVAGLKTALNIEISARPDGTFVKAGIGLFKQRAIPALIVGLAYWPALVGQLSGLVRQAGLDEEAVNVIEAELQRYARVREAARESENRSRKVASTPTSRFTAFCARCGAPLGEAARFCPMCGSGTAVRRQRPRPLPPLPTAPISGQLDPHQAVPVIKRRPRELPN